MNFNSQSSVCEAESGWMAGFQANCNWHWLVADGWCWFVLREEYCWLVAGGWCVVREKYCWLVADKPNEQGADPPYPSRRTRLSYVFGSG
jgi:hypothetical protein